MALTLSVSLGSAVTVLSAQVAAANTWTVTNCNDSGVGSLRNAVASASSGDTINFEPSPSCATITLTSGQIEIAKSVSISGPGANTLAVSGDSSSRIFQVDAAVTVGISGLTMADGAEVSPSAQGGGGILNSGNLTVSNSVLSGNIDSHGGGGIVNSGTLTILNCTLSDNNTVTSGSGAGSGGGILNGGDVTISNSTLSDNIALAGGAIANFGGNVSVTNSTVSGNVAKDGGSVNGGAIINFNTDAGTGTMALTATIMANSASGGDCHGYNIDDNGYNIDDDGTCGLTGTSISDSSTLDGTLGPLANYGGPTDTIPLLTGSPALAQVPAPDCPVTDQRGNLRGVPCDIGAYEAGQVSPQAITFTSTAPSTATVSASPYMVTATGGASENPILFAIDASSTAVCSLSGTVVSFVGVGTCTIDANQAGTTGYAAAPEVQQSFVVGPGTPTTPTITNIPSPGPVLVGGSFLPVVSTTGDGTTSVSSLTTPVCTVSSHTVDYVGVGTCTLMAHVTAGANYTAADGSPQSFTVNPQPQAIVSANNATATVGSLFSFTVMTTGTPVPSISKEGMLPRHLALADNGNGTAVIAGLPKKAGTYRFSVKATFGTGRTKHVVTQPFTLTVDPG